MDAKIGQIRGFRLMLVGGLLVAGGIIAHYFLGAGQELTAVLGVGGLVLTWIGFQTG